MREVQEVVAVRLGPGLGGVLVAVGFDLFRVRGPFAAPRPGAGEDGLLAVPDQRDQPREGRGVAVPLDCDLQAASWINSTSMGVERLLDLPQPGPPREAGG